MLYLLNTFSPMMMAEGTGIKTLVKEISIYEAMENLEKGFTSGISHEITAKIISVLLMENISFDRKNIVLNRNDKAICIVPNFRADVAREFTWLEVTGAGYRCFKVDIVEIIK